MTQRVIEVTADETAYLMRNLPPRTPFELSFGPGWCALTWDDAQEMPPAVRLILLKRGLLNENMDGAGI